MRGGACTTTFTTLEVKPPAASVAVTVTGRLRAGLRHAAGYFRRHAEDGAGYAAGDRLAEDEDVGPGVADEGNLCLVAAINSFNSKQQHSLALIRVILIS